MSEYELQRLIGENEHELQRLIGEIEPPLTRRDVEHRLQQAGSPDKLNLGSRNLQGIDLSGLTLSGANLFEADLRRAILVDANLSNADLRGANLSNADLRGANLSNVDTTDVELSGANISGSTLERRQLRERRKQDRLRHQEWLRRQPISASEVREQNSALEEKSLIHIRITEEPLTPQNVALTLTALTELTTSFWLMAKRRFADLIEYIQTHDIRFAYEAGTVITKVSYNSPFDFCWKVDISAPSVAEAFVTTLDGIKQRDERRQKAVLENISIELENQAMVQKIKEADQQLKQQQEMAAIEREKQKILLENLRLKNDKNRLALVAQRLDMQKKQIEDALELAGQ